MNPNRPNPGERYRISNKCGWKPRRGCIAVVVDTAGVKVYPVHGLPRSETVVFIPDDPLSKPDRLPNGEPWTCVVDTTWLERL